MAVPDIASIIPLSLRTTCDELIGEMIPELVALRHHLHAHPELSWREHGTMAYLSRRLTDLGISHRTGIGGTGIIADIPGGARAPVIAYRTDMDALPITEQGTVPYRSTTPGVMHACGHDFHMAAAVGMAKLLATIAPELPGSFRIIFQPAEEVCPSGSRVMVDGGAMDGVAAIFASHVDPSIPTGVIGLRYGAAMAAYDQFKLTINGRTGHSSRPHESIDAILAAAKIVEAVGQIPARLIDPLVPSVINITTIHGGEAPNVISGEVAMTGALRCLSSEGRLRMREALARTVEGIAGALGAHHHLAIEEGAPVVVNNPRLTDIVRGATIDALGEEFIHVFPRPSMGGEDFSVYTQYAPGAIIHVGSPVGGVSSSIGLHHERFNASDDIFGHTLGVMARALVARTLMETEP